MNMTDVFRKRIKEEVFSEPARELMEDEYFCPDDGLIYCSKCKTPRQTALDLFGIGRVQRLPVVCSCKKKKLEDEKNRRERERRREFLEKRRRDGLADDAYRKCRFEGDRGFNRMGMEKAKKYAEQWERVKEKNVGLLIWGDTGSGKTFTAACIANALVDKGVRVKMTCFPRLADELTGQYFNRRSELIDGLNEYDLLVIDDLGAERGTEFNLEQIYRIVDGRYRSGKPMIVTTNLKPDDMSAAKSVEYKRIYDRILEMCVPLRMSEMNIRKVKAAGKLNDAREILI